MAPEAASGHRSSGKLRRAIAASAVAEPRVPAQPVQDVELDAAKDESIGALVRRYVGERLSLPVLSILLAQQAPCCRVPCVLLTAGQYIDLTLKWDPWHACCVAAQSAIMQAEYDDTAGELTSW